MQIIQSQSGFTLLSGNKFLGIFLQLNANEYAKSEGKNFDKPRYLFPKG
jgi:hypothetical protein